jgi:2-polyprenyl-3-methyl-5-hydroxy-6-metoxy-1,4-benzoquinol methylase
MSETGVTADGLLPDEAVRWAVRLFLGREPTGQAEVHPLRRHPTLDALRIALAETSEFDEFCWRASGHRPRYAVPPFMLKPPTNAELPWRFAAPTLEEPVSQLCTYSQFGEPAFHEIAEAMALERIPHRGIWGHVYIVSVLATEGLVVPGSRAIGFGCGAERIPALLASRGVSVLASDLPGPAPAERLEAMFDARVIHREDYDSLVGFHPIDMNDLPDGLDGQFDCLWSSSAMQHLGSIRRGMEFVERSLAALRPGGLAVHTTEFNLDSNEATVQTPDLSVFRRRDIEALASRLIARGHEVLPINLHPGHEKEDEVIDLPPYGLPHLKLIIGRHILTSFGLAVRKKR